MNHLNQPTIFKGYSVQGDACSTRRPAAWKPSRCKGPDLDSISLVIGTWVTLSIWQIWYWWVFMHIYFDGDLYHIQYCTFMNAMWQYILLWFNHLQSVWLRVSFRVSFAPVRYDEEIRPLPSTEVESCFLVGCLSAFVQLPILGGINMQMYGIC